MSPLISIIVPVYNVEDYIEECFESIIKQLPKADVEVICIDDGSTDKSGIICDKYAKKNSKIKVVHQLNQGVAAARNNGLKFASGQYIAWIDPDDYIADDWYEKISKVISDNKNIEIIFFDYTILKNNKKIIKKYKSDSGLVSQKNFMYEIALDQNIQSQLWQKIFHRSLFDDIKFPVSAVCMEDYAVLHKIIIKAEKIYYISRPLYFYRVRDNSLITRFDLEKSYSCYLIARERYEFLKEHRFTTSISGYLMQALGVCLQYHQCNALMRIAFKEKFEICRNAINQNIVALLQDKNSNIKLKIKFLLVYCNLIKPAVCIHGFIKSLW